MVRFSLMSLFLLTSCAEFHTGRTYLSEMEHDDSTFFSPSEDFPVMAGDTGQMFMTEKERRARTPGSEKYLAEDRRTRALKEELRNLEGLQSDENLDLYSEHKDRLSLSEKIYFLKLPPYERRDYLMVRGFIPEPRPSYFSQPGRKIASQEQQIALGMTKTDVISSWGKPSRVDVAGNPRNENERWLYHSDGASKYVYFESGKVEGWE